MRRFTRHLVLVGFAFAEVSLVYSAITGEQLLTNVEYTTAGQVVQAVIALVTAGFAYWIWRDLGRLDKEYDEARKEQR